MNVMPATGRISIITKHFNSWRSVKFQWGIQLVSVPTVLLLHEYAIQTKAPIIVTSIRFIELRGIYVDIVVILMHLSVVWLFTTALDRQLSGAIVLRSSPKTRVLMMFREDAHMLPSLYAKLWCMIVSVVSTGRH